MKNEVNDLLQKTISRRSLLATSGKAGAAIAAASSVSLPFAVNAASDAGKTAEVGQETVRHSACLVNCGSRCALKVIVKDDTIVRIEPETSPNEAEFGKHQIRPCLRGRSSRWRVYNPDRLKYPMMRTGKRGEGKFKRITWEEAIEFFSSRLKYTIEKYGNEAVYYPYQSGAYYHTQGTTAWQRLLNLTGGYLRYYNNYSAAQVDAISPYMWGAEPVYASHFDQIKNSDLVIFFGMNAAETRVSGGGQSEELRRALAISQAKTIIVDPRHTDTVVSQNAEWLPIKPTSDSALVAGIVHTLISEDLIDEEMIHRYCIGFDAQTLPESAPSNASYKDYILGNGNDKTEKTPEWAEAVTGIAAKRIRQLAREIAAAKACFIIQGWGPQRHANGEQTARSIHALPLISGHFGRPGTNSGNWPWGTYYGVPKLPVGTNPINTAIPCYLWTDAVAHPEVMTDKTHGVRGKEKLDVGIKFIINQAGNALINQHGNINRTRQILGDETLCETVVVCDTHMTPSARFADLILPETTYLEAEDLVDSSYASGSHHYMIALQKTITPLWEVRSTYDMCADIAEKFGLRDAFTDGRTQNDWIQKNYAEVKTARPYLPEWNVAKDMGVIDQQKTPDDKCIAFADFRRSPETHPLRTPSGKAEIYSEALAKLSAEWILADDEVISPIPAYCPAWESHMDTEMVKKYPLQLIGFHTKGHTHSTYANIAQLQEAVRDEVWMNPIDASYRGIKPGDLVHVYNDRGTVQLPVRVTQRIIPGVAAIPQGAWTQDNGKGVDIGGCINTLTNERPSPVAKGNPQHTNLVEIKKA